VADVILGHRPGVSLDVAEYGLTLDPQQFGDFALGEFDQSAFG